MKPLTPAARSQSSPGPSRRRVSPMARQASIETNTATRTSIVPREWARFNAASSSHDFATPMAPGSSERVATAVTPRDTAHCIARATAESLWLGEGRGTIRSTGVRAFSFSAPVGFPGSRVPHDRAPADVGASSGDAGPAKRYAVGECHVPVEPTHIDRVVRCHRIDPAPFRQGGAGPTLVVPTTAGDPFTRCKSEAAEALIRAMNSLGDGGASRRSTLTSCSPPASRCA